MKGKKHRAAADRNNDYLTWQSQRWPSLLNWKHLPARPPRRHPFREGMGKNKWRWWHPKCWVDLTTCPVRMQERKAQKGSCQFWVVRDDNSQSHPQSRNARGVIGIGQWRRKYCITKFIRRIWWTLILFHAVPLRQSPCVIFSRKNVMSSSCSFALIWGSPLPERCGRGAAFAAERKSDPCWWDRLLLWSAKLTTNLGTLLS